MVTPLVRCSSGQFTGACAFCPTPVVREQTPPVFAECPTGLFCLPHSIDNVFRGYAGMCPGGLDGQMAHDNLGRGYPCDRGTSHCMVCPDVPEAPGFVAAPEPPAPTPPPYTPPSQPYFVCNDDDGVNITRRGITNGHVDDCRRDDPTSVTEYFCAGPRDTSNIWRCPVGMTCSEGACIASGAQGHAPNCTDSDGGFNIRVAGTAHTDNNSYADADMCGDEVTLQETYCEPSGSIQHVSFPCPDGAHCIDGACQ